MKALGAAFILIFSLSSFALEPGEMLETNEAERIDAINQFARSNYCLLLNTMNPVVHRKAI